MIDYASTKGAIIAFTKALATHLIPKGIRVNAVAYVLLLDYPLSWKPISSRAVNPRPGAVYTPIQADTREAKQMEGWGQKALLGRPAQPSEVAPTFVFLATAEATLYCKCFVQAQVGTGLYQWNEADIDTRDTDGQVMHCYPLGD